MCSIYNAAINERKSTFETELRSAADFETRISDERFPHLVSDGTEGILGWAGLAAYSSRPCYAGIAECSVYVAPEGRGCGFGTTLAEALASSAGESGFHKLVGKVFTGNQACIRLIKRCGFQAVGVHCRHGQLDGEWRDVLVVERLLTTPVTPHDCSTGT